MSQVVKSGAVLSLRIAAMYGGCSALMRNEVMPAARSFT